MHAYIHTASWMNGQVIGSTLFGSYTRLYFRTFWFFIRPFVHTFGRLYGLLAVFIMWRLLTKVRYEYAYLRILVCANM